MTRRRLDRRRPAAYLLGQAAGWLIVFAAATLLGLVLVLAVRIALGGVL